MSVNNPSIDPDILVAYVDGELETERAAEVEAALAKDPQAQNMVRLMRLSASAASHAFDRVKGEPLPPRLLEATRRPATVRARAWRKVARSGWAAAACLAGLLIGLGGGFLLHSGPEGYSPAAAKAADPLAASFQSALFGALSGGQPGHMVEYGDEGTGRGRILLGRQLVTGFGAPCQEFSREETKGDVHSRTDGLACRGKDGGWAVMLLPAD